MPGLADQAKVWGQGTGVSTPSGLLVGVGRGHVVGELAGALEHVAVTVGSVGVLDLLGHRLGLGDSVGDADEVAPGDAVEGVARRADFAVDLVAATDAARENCQRSGSCSGW